MGRTMRGAKRNEFRKLDNVKQLGVFLAQVMPTNLTSTVFSNVTATPNLPTATLTSPHANDTTGEEIVRNFTLQALTLETHPTTANLSSPSTTPATQAATVRNEGLTVSPERPSPTPEAGQNSSTTPFVCDVDRTRLAVPNYTKRQKTLSAHNFDHSRMLAEALNDRIELTRGEDLIGFIYTKLSKELKSTKGLIAQKFAIDSNAPLRNALRIPEEFTPAQQECLMAQKKLAVNEWYATYASVAIQKIEESWDLFKFKFPRDLASTLIGLQSYTRAMKTCDELKWKNLTPEDVTRALATSIQRQLRITLNYLQWVLTYRRNQYHVEYEDYTRVEAKFFHCRAMGQAEVRHLRDVLKGMSKGLMKSGESASYVVVIPVSPAAPNGIWLRQDNQPNAGFEMPPTTKPKKANRKQNRQNAMLDSVNPYRAHQPIVEDNEFTDTSPEYLRGDRLFTVTDALREFTEWSASPDRKVGDTIQCTNDTTEFIVERPVNGLDTYSFHGVTKAGENLDLTLIRVRESDDDITTFAKRQPVSRWTAPIRGMFKVSALFPNLTLENRHNTLGEPTNQIEDIFLAFDHVEVRPADLSPYKPADIYTYLLYVLHDAYHKFLNGVSLGKFTMQDHLGFKEDGQIAFRSVITREERTEVSPQAPADELESYYSRNREYCRDIADAFDDMYKSRVEHPRMFAKIMGMLRSLKGLSVPPYEYIIGQVHKIVCKYQMRVADYGPSRWLKPVAEQTLCRDATTPATETVKQTSTPPTTSTEHSLDNDGPSKSNEADANSRRSWANTGFALAAAALILQNGLA